MQASSRPRNISAWQLTSQLTKNHCRSERTCESLSTKSCFSAKTRCGFGMERVCAPQTLSIPNPQRVLAEKQDLRKSVDQILLFCQDALRVRDGKSLRRAGDHPLQP